MKLLKKQEIKIIVCITFYIIILYNYYNYKLIMLLFLKWQNDNYDLFMYYTIIYYLKLNDINLYVFFQKKKKKL